MVLAGILALVVFVGGPTILILNLLPTAIGDYFGNLAQMAARTAATGGDATAEWLSGWTVFYWAWWISWTPFVGMFIARISRGRTIRQFVAGVILIPSAVSLLWFAIFGGAAINLQRSGTDLASQTIEGQLFGLLDTMPLGAVARRHRHDCWSRSSSSPAPTPRRSSWARCPSAARSTRRAGWWSSGAR